GIFRHGKEIKGLRGGVHRYAAQENPKIDTARVEKGTFRMETTSLPGRRMDGLSQGECLCRIVFD
ncbi:MAG: hypothetical protein ACLQVJ_11815, partial [Syntrophobacteraceae bacterium]